MVNIKGLSKAAVLAALYNASRPQGFGMLQFDPTPMTEAEASKLLEHTTYFDYLKGRVMKVNLQSNESFDERLYDRDNGPGAAQSAIDKLTGSAPFRGLTDILVGERQSGKTTQLIKLAAKDRGVIIAPTSVSANYIKTQATQMGLDIPEPISLFEFLHMIPGKRNGTYYIDEANVALGQLGIKAITVDASAVRQVSMEKADGAGN